MQGDTLETLEVVMREKGPDNLAGENIWSVSWSPEPRTVSMSATISLPKLIGKRNFADEDLVIWDEMLVALEDYQNEHIAFGRGAADEIRSLNCTTEEEGGIDGVIAKWREKGAALDISTENGKTAGVTLERPQG